MQHLRFTGATLLLCVVAAMGSAAPLTVPAGVPVTVRMLDEVGSATSYAGETFRATLEQSLMVDGKTLVPRGAEAIGRLVSVERAGRFQGRPTVTLELTALNFEGQSVAIQTSAHQEKGASQTKRTAILAGGGTVLGTIIAAVAGGGIMLGSNVGGAAGTVAQAVSGTKDLRIPAEALVTFTLQSPIYLFESGL
jgi:hypothetical protein